MANMYDLFSAIISRVNSAVKSVGGKKPDNSGNVVVSYNDLSDVPSAFTPASHTHSLSNLSGRVATSLKDAVVLEHNDMNVSTKTNVAAGTQTTLISFRGATSGDSFSQFVGSDMFQIDINISMNASDEQSVGVAGIRLECDTYYDGTVSNVFGNRVLIPIAPKLYSMSKISARVYIPNYPTKFTITAQPNINAVYHGCSITISKPMLHDQNNSRIGTL